MKRKFVYREKRKKPLKLCNWINAFSEGLQFSLRSVKNKAAYKLGLERLSKILDGYLNKFTVTNFQFSNIEHIVPTSLHLIFPEIFGRYAEEISNAIGCFHNKKCCYILSDRGVGKTFAAVLYIANLLMNTPAGTQFAFCGVQMIHATNLLSSLASILEKYDTKNIFDRPPKVGIEHMKIYKDGKVTLIKCYPGKGESFRGNNEIEYVLFDEFDFADLKFILDKVLPHFLRYRMGSAMMSTKNYPGCPNEVFHKSTDLMEVNNATRICPECLKLSNWEQRKQCNHVEVPDQPNQDGKLRKIIGSYMPAETEAAELYGDSYRNPDNLFCKEMLNKFFNGERKRLTRKNFYSISFDPNQEGDSECGTVIYSSLNLGRRRTYLLEYLNSFPSNEYNIKLNQFKRDIEIFVININKNKTYTYLFMESNTGNIGKDLEEWIEDEGYDEFIRVVYGRKYDKKIRKHTKAGYPKTQRRTICYVQEFNRRLASNDIFISADLKTDESIRYNTPQIQLNKFRDQLLRWRVVNGQHTGKFDSVGNKKNDDLSVAGLAGIWMPEELHDPRSKLFSQTFEYKKKPYYRVKRRTF